MMTQCEYCDFIFKFDSEDIIRKKHPENNYFPILEIVICPRCKEEILLT